MFKLVVTYTVYEFEGRFSKLTNVSWGEGKTLFLAGCTSIIINYCRSLYKWKLYIKDV